MLSNNGSGSSCFPWFALLTSVHLPPPFPTPRTHTPRSKAFLPRPQAPVSCWCPLLGSYFPDGISNPFSCCLKGMLGFPEVFSAVLQVLDSEVSEGPSSFSLHRCDRHLLRPSSVQLLPWVGHSGLDCPGSCSLDIFYFSTSQTHNGQERQWREGGSRRK